MEALNLKDVLDLGATGLLCIAVIVLWRRVGELTGILVLTLDQAKERIDKLEGELRDLNAKNAANSAAREHPR